MQTATSPARQTRTHYRHELRTLTYVTVDEANGGIIRNLNHEGVAVQAVGPLRRHQRVRLRFELRFPRLRVETYGQVSWATPSGQCGIRFVDLPARTRRQINEWIFSNLLGAVARDEDHSHSMFGASVVSIVREENVRETNADEENAPEESDGLTLSTSSRPVIRLEPNIVKWDEAPVLHRHSEEDITDPADHPYGQLTWLSRGLSYRDRRSAPVRSDFSLHRSRTSAMAADSGNRHGSRGFRRRGVLGGICCVRRTKPGRQTRASRIRPRRGKRM
jgi:hypothetical protein